MKTRVRHHYRRTSRGYVPVRRHVREVGSELKDYAGMNHEAGRVMGFSPNPRPDHILVSKKLTVLDKKKTVVHEKIEEGLMRRGWPYWKAHKAALRAEEVVKHPGRDVLPDQAFNAQNLRVGALVEHEHTNNGREARRIAKEHLLERPDYYVRLKKVEG
jgi:hypothetical protein